MTISASPKLADSTEFPPIRSESGSKTSDCEHLEVSPADRLSLMASSANVQAANREPTTTSGTLNEPPPSLMQWAIPERDSPFSIRSSGNVGQEIVDANGRVVAWTTGELVAAVICHLLNGNQELLQ